METVKNHSNMNNQSLQYTANDALDYALNLKNSTLSDTSKADYKSKCNQFKKYLEENHQLLLTFNK